MTKNRLIVLLIGLWIVAVLSLRTPYAWGKTFSMSRVSDSPHELTTAVDDGHHVKLKKHRHKIKTDQRHFSFPTIDFERMIVRVDTPALIIATPKSGPVIPRKGRAPPRAQAPQSRWN